MKKFYLYLILPLILILQAACLEQFSDPLPLDTPAPSITPEPSNTPEPTETPTPSPTPTPAPLSPSQIFDLISPSVAFIETEVGTGSGLLTADQYVITNAHVAWPYESVRVVFPDGSEFLDVPVVSWDLLGDLALLGPIETDLPQVPLVDGEEIEIGSETYLIGYPGESEEFPLPTIGKGLVSRIREWEKEEITYFQTDANVAGGQSGGVMISEFGEVIGITGFSYTEANYGLVASAKDLLPRIEILRSGEDISGSSDRSYDLSTARDSFNSSLIDYWDSDVYLFEGVSGEEVSISMVRGAGTELLITDPYGFEVEFTEIDETDLFTNYIFDVNYSGFYIVEVYPLLENFISPRIDSDVELYEFIDGDDRHPIRVGKEYIGNLDYPGDFDYIQIELEEGDEINIRVESVLIDPFIVVFYEESFAEYIVDPVFDDDSGGGLFDLDAELTYQAPRDGFYYIQVSDSYNANTGAYYINASEVYEGAPTPTAPELVINGEYLGEVEDTEVGDLRTYTYPEYGFQIQFPAGWDFSENQPDSMSMFADLCEEGLATDCLSGVNGALIIAIEDLSLLGIDDESKDRYYELIEGNSSEFVETSGRRNFTTDSGIEAVIIESGLGEGLLSIKRLIIIKDGTAFNATYLIIDSSDESLEELIEYSFAGVKFIEE